MNDNKDNYSVAPTLCHGEGKTENGKQKTKKEIGNDNKDNFSASPTLLSGKKNENQQVEEGKYENRSAEGQAPMLGAAGSPNNLLIFGVHCRCCLCCR